MPGPRRFFGSEPAHATIDVLLRWAAAGHRRDDPVYLGALETLHAYVARLDAFDLDASKETSNFVRRFLADCGQRTPSLATPQPLPGPSLPAGADPVASFRTLAQARRSVRDFRSDCVEEAVLLDAISIAQLSPSACNRQPWFVYLINDKTVQKNILKYQNGNRGFGHLSPHLAVITAEEECFFDASERHEPYIDGGLFAMSFALALSSHGVGSCCLNWCVAPSHDRAVHSILNIPLSKRIVMLMAIGYASDDCVVPRSPRRAIEDVCVIV